MDRDNRKEDDSNQKPTSSSNMKNGSNQKDYSKNELKSTSGPTALLLWVWNWFATLPQAMTNLYADFKNGDLLSRFSFLDAMLQFIVAVATSCHPQEDSFSGESDEKSESSTKEKEVKTFGGPGRTLRPRTVATNS